MEKFLQMTAWRMAVPRLYGCFHIFTAALGIVFAAGAAIICAKVYTKIYRKSNAGGSSFSYRLYMIIGLVLLFSEGYKQLFNFYVMNDRRYDWHLLPLQLCSLPMYFCFIIPWLRSKGIKTALNTFMADFNLMGAVMVFADPSGIFSKYAVLTVHGILWHLLVIFIGLFAGLTNLADTASLKSFLKTLPVFFISSGLAIAVNIVLHPYGGANMFYIDPYTPSVQLVFRDIAAAFGIAAGNTAYFLAMIFGGFLCHFLFWFFHGRKR